MNLCFYEWKKLWKNAAVLKIFLFFLFLSGIVFGGEITSEKEVNMRYLELHENIDRMEIENAKTWFLEEQKKESMDRSGKIAMEYLEEEILACSEYAAYRQNIQNKYEQVQSISIFTQGDEGQKEYMGQIAEKYKDLQVNAPMELQPYQGLKRVLDFRVSDILGIVLLLYLISVVFLQEQKDGKEAFAYTMINGTEKLFGAKVFTVCGSFVSYLLITFLSNLLLSKAVFGSVSFEAAIQSVPDFYAVPYTWTIGEYMSAMIALKILAALFVTAASILLVKWLRSEMQMALSMALLIGISIWMEQSVIGDGIRSVFRIWNVWALLGGNTIINDYELIVLDNVIIESVWGICVFLLLSVVILIFCGLYPWKEKKQRKPKLRKREKKPHGLFYYELKKIWIYQGGLFLLLASVAVQAMITDRYHNYIGTDDIYYHSYIDKLGDLITGETDAKILEEEKYLEKLKNEMETTKNPMNAQRLQLELECMGGFEKYKDRVISLCVDNKEPVILKDEQYRLLFSNTDVSRTFVVLLCVGFAFLIPAAYYMEKETGVETLQQVSIYGRRKIWLIKIGALLIYYILFILLSGVLTFFKVNKMYDLRWDASAECLQTYWYSNNGTSILSTFIIGILVQCVVAAIVVFLLSVFAKRIRNQYVMTGILLGGLVVPTILFPYSAIRELRWVHDFFFVFTGKASVLTISGGILLIVVGVFFRREWKES